MYIITYDQFDEDEEFNIFENLDEVLAFAQSVLHGRYPDKMPYSDMRKEMEKNGYFLDGHAEYTSWKMRTGKE